MKRNKGAPGRRRVLTAALLSALCAIATAVQAVPWPAFTATTLTGEKVESSKLLGQPTLLVVTPSKEAAESTRQWVNALREQLDTSKYRVRDVLAIDLPFFMSEEDAIGRAKEKVPDRYHDQTWILDSTVIEEALKIPQDSEEAAVVVLDAEGKVVAQVHGSPTDGRLNEVVRAAKSTVDASK